MRTERSRTNGWAGIALVGAAFAITMLGTTLPTPLYPRYAARFDFGELITTVIYAVYAVGVITGLVLFGHWSDQLGRRPMLFAGLILSGLSAVCFLLPAAVGWLYAGRMLSGLSAGIFTGTATATMVDLAPESGRSRAGLVAAAANMGGLGLGPLLAGVLSQYAPHPLQLCFVVDLIVIVLGIGCVLLVADPVEPVDERRLAPRALEVPESIRAIFTRAAIAGFAGFAVLGLFTSVSPAFLGKVLHHGNAALVGAVVLCAFAASVVGQTVTARLGTDRALKSGCLALIAGMAIVAVSLVAHSLALLVVGALVAGGGHGMSFRAGLSSVAEASPADQRGTVTSTFFVVLYVGISIPVIGVGALATAAGLVTAGVVFAALVALLAGVAWMLLQRA